MYQIIIDGEEYILQSDAMKLANVARTTLLFLASKGIVKTNRVSTVYRKADIEKYAQRPRERQRDKNGRYV